MNASRIPAITALAALLLVWPLLPACNKEKPTKAIITVKRENGNTVPGVFVKLFANPTIPLGDPSRLTKTATTDASGRAEFDYTDFYEQGQAGFAVLDILATKDTLVGEGIIKIVEEETSEETVILRPATP